MIISKAKRGTIIRGIIHFLLRITTTRILSTIKVVANTPTKILENIISQDEEDVGFIAIYTAKNGIIIYVKTRSTASVNFISEKGLLIYQYY